MSDVRAWLDGQRERLRRLPSLEDALLGGGGLRYAFYRLRYVFVRALLRTTFRLAELALFASAFPFEILGPVLVARSVLLVAGGLWWGALETLRRDVRVLHRLGRAPEASQRIDQWLGAAGSLSGIALAAALMWIWLGPSPFESFNVVDVYVVGCAVRWCADVLARTYHSGVYGLRRVYRPVWSLLLVDIGDVAVLVVFYLWLGPWGVGVAMGAMGLLRASISVAFTERTYRQLRLEVGPPLRWFRALLRGDWEVGHSLRFAFGNAVAQVDALLVLALLAASGSERDSLLLAALFHVMSPLQSASFGWTKLFYFDFKRLEGWGSPLLLQRFEVFLGRVLRWVPIPIGLVTLALMAALWRGPFWLLTAELTALAAVRAWLSVLHVRAYSLADHPYLSRLSLGMLAVVVAAMGVAQLPPEVALGLVATSMAVGLLLLGSSTRPLLVGGARRFLSPSAWLRELLRTQVPVRLGLARVDRSLTSVGRMARALGPQLDSAVMTRLSADTLAWFETQPVSSPALIEHGCGCLKELCLGAVVASGQQAVRSGLPTESWRRHVASVIEDASAPSGLSSLSQALQEVSASFTLADLRGDMASIEGVGPAHELRRLIVDASHGRGGFNRLGTCDVAVVAPGGLPCAAVVVRRGARLPSNGKGRAALLIRMMELRAVVEADPGRISS